MSPSATPATQKTAASQPTTGDQAHSKSQPSAVSATPVVCVRTKLWVGELSVTKICDMCDKVVRDRVVRERVVYDKVVRDTSCE